MMSSRNRVNIPEARQALDKMKFEIAGQLGVNLKQGYNGDLTSRENGYVGGYMVRKMIEDYENAHK
ncbi:small, acid-soluble spore protein, alpha/beta type [Bacillota bacterium Meth-B3]|nr:alpha/beta-type small acid-soluble spore protein [Christensenellaceae bacterium]MEA5068053.1 alpha/beta-type small acid-soluble spore protein [Christensenellaceae bacterium]